MTNMRAIIGLMTLFLALTNSLSTVNTPPPNDDFVNPAKLSGTFVLWTGELTGATWEQGEEQMVYGGSVWAHWIAPTTGLFRVIDPYWQPLDVSVFEGESLASLKEVDNFILFGGTFHAHAGKLYIIRVAAPEIVADRFYVRLSPVLPNETPSGALELTGTNVDISTQNWTSITDILPLANETAVWYKWKAPDDGILTYVSDTNAIRPSIWWYHQHSPTLDTNVFEPYSTTRRFPPDSASVSVRQGITYVMAFRSRPSTNLNVSLTFARKSTGLESVTNILFGGNTLPSLDTATYHSAPNALQFGGIARSEHAWFEMVFRGPGTLSFRTKVAGFNSAAIRYTGTNWSQSITLNTSTEDWVLHTFDLPRATNIIRWTILNFADGSSRMTAWFDDITFTPTAAAQPLLTISSSHTRPPVLNLPLEAYRTTVVETSTDLTSWTAWTNFFSSTNVNRSLALPKKTSQTAVFYRAHIPD